MEEREISKLWYFANGLIHNPEYWEDYISAVRNAPIRPSKELEEGLCAIEDCFISGKDNIPIIANELFESPKDSIQQMGRALLWALEQLKE